MEANIQSKPGDTHTGSPMVKIVQYLGITCTGVGALVLLIEGLEKAGEITRFFSFSALLAICASLGLFLSLRRGDQRGARLLFGIFLSLIPVFWSQLAAVVHATFATDLDSVPMMFRFSANSPVLTILGLLCGGLIITPLTLIVSKIFVPSMAKQYGLFLSLLGLIFIIPLRSGVAADLFLLIAAVAVVLAERLIFSKSQNGTKQSVVTL